MYEIINPMKNNDIMTDFAGPVAILYVYLIEFVPLLLVGHKESIYRKLDLS